MVETGPDATSQPTQQLIDDLASAEYDILSLAQRHGLSLDGLVDWACQSETRRIVSGLCVLADAQTQLLLSRYRLVAATRLIAQATADADTLPPEQIRKACVDLLKTELSRAADLGADDDRNEDDELEALRVALNDLPCPSSDHELNDAQANQSDHS